MYLTFDEYTEMGGQVVEETTFAELEFEARTIIDWWTFNRLQNEENYTEPVKRCMYKLISLLNEKQLALAIDTSDSSGSSKIQPGITSESNDGVSTAYNTLSAKEAMDTIGDEIKSTIKMYLQSVRNSLGQKVLYRGVYPNE